MPSTAMTKNELINEMSDELGYGKGDIRSMLELLAEIAVDEIAEGNDFVVPGVVRMTYRYTKPRKKGDKYTGFGGEELVAEANRPARVKLSVLAVKDIKQVAATDVKSKAGKAVAAAKG